MKKPDISKMVKNAQAILSKHSPEILTGIGVAGLLTTTVLAVRATPKALTLIEGEKKKKHVDKLTPVETVKTAWKPYIPAAVTGVMATACIIGASSVNAKRNAALATAYTISETALKEYREKVVETIGEKKEQAVRDSVAKEKVEKNPVSNNEVIITEKGNTLCYDSISGRYFRSDIDKIRRAASELDYRLRSEMYVSLNDFYYELGLPAIRMGEDLGWNVDQGPLTIDYSSQLAEDGTPCLVMDYHIAPRYDYRTLY